jgi:hypothetical protein
MSLGFSPLTIILHASTIIYILASSSFDLIFIFFCYGTEYKVGKGYSIDCCHKDGGYTMG